MRGSRPRSRPVIVAVAIAAAVAVSAPPAGAAAPVKNGTFETGTLEGWRRANRGEGAWFAYQGTETPQTGNRFFEPPRGTWGAVTDMNGPGAHLLHQVVKLPRGQTHKLRFFLAWRNRSEAGFVNGPGFRFNGPPNQKFRIDIVKPRAPLWTTRKRNILAQVFHSDEGLARRRAPKGVVYDLSRFAGRRVRIRFAEVDNQNFLHVGIDHVRITS